ERSSRSPEKLSDPFVELGPEVVGLHLFHLAADDLGQVRLDHEPQDRPGAVVKKERFRDESCAGLFDEALFDRGETDTVLEGVGSDTLGGTSKGQGMQVDGSGDVGMDRELAGEILQVEFLGGGLLILL